MGANAFRWAAVVCCLLCAATPARAQEGARREEQKPPPPPDPVLTRPPELIEAAQAEYPAGAAGDADVKVRIQIDATGTVGGVELPEPRGDAFDEAARSAALRYR